ncbi:MAG: polyhydroxyalkanoate synthesis regulator DNA-binding domain-containing protein [Anaerolineales bacterium]|jgi:polyhydroxyalkanoate synthesis repressor PhaR
MQMLTIKRYPNRKFYDTEQKRYITLEDISEQIRLGREVHVVDQNSGEDITSIVLTQIIFEQEKKNSGFVPRAILTGLVQAGGYTMGRMRSALANPLELLKQIDLEIENRIDRLIKQGELAEDEARRWRDKLLSDQEDSNPVSGVDEEEIQRLLDERGVPTRSEIESLTAQIDLLTKKLETLDEQ